MNPRIVEFSPSADHSVTLPDGRAAVSRYDFEVYAAGASAPFQTVNMGKPTPQTDGLIRYDFSSTIPSWPLPGGTYESRVAAVGPNGTARSAASNTFTLGTSSCSFTVAPLTASVSSAAGTTSVSVATAAGCNWTATSGASWITVSPASGSGNGSATLSFTANTSTTSRRGTVNIAGITVTVTQSAACTYTVAPLTSSVSSDAGTVNLTVSTAAGCTWAATSSASWITVSPSTGSGTGSVTASYDVNRTTTSRIGTLTVAGQAVTVGQAANSGVITVATEPELQAAVTSVPAGGTIVIAAGTYRLTRPLMVRGANNVTLRGATGNRDDVVLRGPGMSANVAPVDGVWTDITGLVVSDLTLRDFYGSAIVYGAGAESPRLRNVRLIDSGALVRAEPDGAGGGAGGGVIESSLLEFTTTGRDAATRGVELQSASGWAVRDNVFRNVRGPAGSQAWPALLAWNGSANTTVERNGFVNCQLGIALGAVERTPDDHTGGIIRNNIVYRTAGEPIGGFGIGVADSPNTKVLHNTVVLSGTYTASIETRYTNTTGALVANNLTDAPTSRRDGATGVDDGNLTSASPDMFVNAAAGDLHLAATAYAARDTGATLQEVTDDWDGQPRPFGAGPDVGADELQVAVSYTLSGRITDQAGAALGGVAVTLSGATGKSAQSDSYGDYSFADLPQGAYTVVPSRTGYTFSPASRALTLAGNTRVDFVGAANAPAGDGLRGEYFNTPNFGTPVATRVDPMIDFAWSGGPISGMRNDGFSIRWTGRVQAQFSQVYTFHTQADGGVRLWVNGQLLISNWKDVGAIENHATISLEAGRWYDLRMEFFDKRGTASARLLWSSPSTAKSVVPQTRLSSR